jgi:hypothetical protein
MSSITLLNNTNYVAQYVVKKGEQVIARIPGIEPNASMTIPTNEVFEVFAVVQIDGNTYTSAPQQVQGSTGFLAQVLQVSAQGTYEFDLTKVPSTKLNTLEFQKTSLSPVTFTITKNGQPLQNVVVNDSFSVSSIDISDTFYVYAVANGVTTSTARFTNPAATITAITSDTILENGYVTLVIA